MFSTLQSMLLIHINLNLFDLICKDECFLFDKHRLPLRYSRDSYSYTFCLICLALHTAAQQVEYSFLFFVCKRCDQSCDILNISHIHYKRRYKTKMQCRSNTVTKYTIIYNVLLLFSFLFLTLTIALLELILLATVTMYFNWVIS